MLSRFQYLPVPLNCRGLLIGLIGRSFSVGRGNTGIAAKSIKLLHKLLVHTDRTQPKLFSYQDVVET